MDELDLGATIKGFSPGQKVFSRYTLKRILGRGGMGVVWLARDEELEREVALKFLPEVVAMDRESVVELKKETRRNLGLTHANIVRVYDFVQGPSTAAISMEYIDGASLSSLKLDQPGHVFRVAQLRPWLEQLCAALDYAHGTARIVHRDLKPANLMVGSRGELKVTDFGVARSVADSVSRVSAQAGSSGTPLYMSPQQMLGEDPAVTDDIYSIGATLYELLTGKPPFHSGNILLQVQNKVPPGLNARRESLGLAPDVPTEWEQVIAQCLAKEPAARPASARELFARLEGASTRHSAPVAVATPAPAPSASPRAPRSNELPAERVRANRRMVLVLFGVGVALGGLYFASREPKGPTAEEIAAQTAAYWARLREEGNFNTRVVTSPHEVYGLQVLLGRPFVPDDFKADAAPVFHLALVAWENAFGRAADVVGRKIAVRGHGEGTVVGVVTYPAEAGRYTSVFIPQRAAPAVAAAAIPISTVAAQLNARVELLEGTPWVIHASARAQGRDGRVALPVDGDVRVLVADVARIFDEDPETMKAFEGFQAAGNTSQADLTRLRRERLAAISRSLASRASAAGADLLLDLSGASSLGTPVVVYADPRHDATASGDVAAPTLVLGFVDLGRVYDGYFKTAETKERLQRAETAAAEELRKMESQLSWLKVEQGALKAQSSNDALNSAAKTKAWADTVATMDKVRALEGEIESFRTNSARSMEQRARNMRELLFEEIVKAAGDVARARNLTLVLDVGGGAPDGSPLVEAGPDAVMLTAAVLEELNRSASTGGGS